MQVGEHITVTACELRNLLQPGKCKVLHKFETDIDGELPLNRDDVNVTTA